MNDITAPRSTPSFPEPSASDQTQTLYELALAIGGGFDTQIVLKGALDAFLSKLHCASGSIYVGRADVVTATPAYASPRDAKSNRSIQITASLLPASLNRENWKAFCANLPRQGATEDGDLYYLLPIDDLGFVTLVRPVAALPAALVAALTPLTNKLAETVRACLHSEELATAHRNTVLERNMLRALIEGTPTIVFALDDEGCFVFSEGHGLKTLGRSSGQVVGHSIFDVYSDVPMIVENIKAALTGERRAVTVQLNNRSWDAMYTPVVDEQGVVTGVVGVAHDVTDRKDAVDTLGAVLNTVGEGIFTVDQQGLIVMVNQELERIFGYGQDELLGRHVGDLIPERHRQAHEASIQHYLDTQIKNVLGQRVEREGRHKSGATFPIDICVNEMTTGARTFFTGSIRDISEQKEYDLLRDEFVSTVSHELRTPLASIMGWTETLLTSHPGPINDAQRRFLNIVYASSQRLNRLIEEILTVSRIQRGTLGLSSEPFHPAQLFALLRDGTTQLAERQGIRLQFDDQWPSDQTVIGDVQLLEQVLSNLIANAIKFSNTGDDVVVRSTRVDGAWRLAVEDHGVGIPAADLPRLFQRFVRGSNAKRDHIQGTGLGLYVSKAIVEGHGGQIQLTSQEGAGTHVWFEIPCTPHSRS